MKRAVPQSSSSVGAKRRRKQPVEEEESVDDSHQKMVNGRQKIMDILMCTKAEKRNGRRKTKKKPTAPFTIVKRTGHWELLPRHPDSHDVVRTLVATGGKNVSVTAVLNMDQETFGQGDFDVDEKRRVFRDCLKCKRNEILFYSTSEHGLSVMVAQCAGTENSKYSNCGWKIVF